MTKKHLGLLFCAGALLGVAGILVLDLIRHKGITTIQLIGIAGCIAALLVGLSLLPLGDDPA